MKKSYVALALVGLVGGCTNPSSGNNAANGGGGAGDAGAGGGNGSGGPGGDGGPGSTSVTPGAKSSCAPADVGFGVPQNFTTHAGSYLVSMASADFNNDGKADLVVLEDKGIEVFLSTGGGKFGPGKFYNNNKDNGNSIVAAQFRPGMADIIASGGDPNDSLGGKASLFTGNGDGTFGSAPAYVPLGTSQMLHAFAVDMNGDHKLDLVFDAQTNSGSGGVALNAGDGKFASPIGMDMPGDWVVGDLNGDGAADLISTPPNGNFHGICVKLNNGSGQLATDPTCLPGPIADNALVNRVAVGDINGDGKLDMIGIYDGSNAVTDDPNFAIYLGKGDGRFGDRNLATLKMDMQGFTLADVNNDGKADLVILAAYYDPKGVDVLLSKGDGTFADTPISFGMGGLAGPVAIDPVVADFSGDGLRGIAVMKPGNDSNGVDVVVATCKK